MVDQIKGAAEMFGTFTTAVAFDDEAFPDAADCTITTSFVMTRMAESPCLDRASFGDPAESAYVLPYPLGASHPVYQSYCWVTDGYCDQLAYDFTIPIGDPIVAARGGVVRGVREDSPDDGQGLGKHNFVFIEHDDGTMLLRPPDAEQRER